MGGPAQVNMGNESVFYLWSTSLGGCTGVISRHKKIDSRLDCPFGSYNS